MTDQPGAAPVSVIDQPDSGQPLDIPVIGLRPVADRVRVLLDPHFPIERQQAGQGLDNFKLVCEGCTDHVDRGFRLLLQQEQR